MDSDGIIVISNNPHTLFQNLLCDKISIDKFLPLLQEIKLDPIVADRKRYDEKDNPQRINVKAKNGWKFIDTTDGAGVFAEEKYFDSYQSMTF